MNQSLCICPCVSVYISVCIYQLVCVCQPIVNVVCGRLYCKCLLLMSIYEYACVTCMFVSIRVYTGGGTRLCAGQVREREKNVLFNDALNTFYLRLYGVRHMVKDHSDSEKGNPLPPHRLLLSINSKGSFICTIPQTG